MEIANFTSEMSPAFNLFQCGQYGNLWLIRAALLLRAAQFPLLPWHQSSAQVGEKRGKKENQNHIRLTESYRPLPTTILQLDLYITIEEIVVM